MSNKSKVIILPKLNIVFQKNGSAILSPGAAKLFKYDYVDVVPYQDNSLFWLKQGTEKTGFKISKEEPLTRIEFNASNILKDILASNPEIPKEFNSIQFEIKHEEVKGKHRTYFATAVCYLR